MHAQASLPPRCAPSTPPSTVGAGRGCLVAGRGAPVVMLHASLGSKSQWMPLVEALAPRYRAIALDLRGYGDLPPAGPGTPGGLDDDLHALEERLDGLVPPSSRIHLVGHSYGGWVALRYARLHPDRVASLALYEPVAFRVLAHDDASLATLTRLAGLIAALVDDGHRHLASQTFVDYWSGEGAFASLSLPVRAGIARRIEKVSLDFRSALAWPGDVAELREITAPVLLLAGRRSPAIAHRIVAALARALPEARSAWIDAGHMGPVTHASSVDALLAAFVDECAGQRPSFREARVA